MNKGLIVLGVALAVGCGLSTSGNLVAAEQQETVKEMTSVDGTGAAQSSKKEALAETAEAAPNQPVRPKNFKPFEFPSARELMGKYSDDMMKRADKLMKEVDQVNAEGKYKTNWESLGAHRLPEWFEDAKFGMFIDWGLYSIAAYVPGTLGYPDWYMHRMMWDAKTYHDKFWGKDFRQDDFIPMFTAKDFDAEYLTDVAKAAGMKYVIPFLKHHDGFCLWDSSFTMRDTVDMGPKRDLAKEWAEACKKRGLKFGFYYSIDDWFYPVIDKNGKLIVRDWYCRHQGMTDWVGKEADWDRRMMDGKIPVKDFYEQYINPAAVEFFNKYDPDIFWGDGDWVYNWEGRNSLRMLAYFYNNAEGRKEVASNDRLGCCRLFPTEGQTGKEKVHGDFVCSECSYSPGMTESRGIKQYWEECHGLSHSFGYNWKETDKDVRSAKELLVMLIDVVADGGNMLLITNLTPSGKLDPLMAERLKEVGVWMRVNGEAIYATRRWALFCEGKTIRFTRSKDGQFVYALCTEWPGKQLVMKSIKAKEGSEITMLGSKAPLAWKQGKEGLIIDIPDSLAEKRPCNNVWVFKMKGEPVVVAQASAPETAH